MKVLAAVTTSSPAPMPQARSASSSAEVPESTPIGVRDAARRREAPLELDDVLAEDPVAAAE